MGTTAREGRQVTSTCQSGQAEKFLSRRRAPFVVDAAEEPVRHWSLTMLREKLIKIGAKIVRHARYVTFQMAEVRCSPKAVSRYSAANRTPQGGVALAGNGMMSVICRARMPKKRPLFLGCGIRE